ncbi:hypothetical protein JHL18_24800 [Clostridium sp. YIM B02505]|uniref:Uncharacterized protein n=1 Tax=Clostridium yunnanense TaxID=2800325 RepID=A0ABS1EX18_9CLOT|nr:hypothetical protein [Clostridium yunnanense]MBK1813843.1 hypothetical protein [Clostridium yunnanense]
MRNIGKAKVLIIPIILCILGVVEFYKIQKENVEANDYSKYYLTYKENLKEEKYSEAKESLSAANAVRSIELYDKKLEECDKLQKSLDLYNQGTYYFNAEQYIEAYTAFNQVYNNDTERYALAQEKLKQCKKLAYEKTIKDSKYEENEKSYAIAAIITHDYLYFIGNDNTIRELNEKYKSLRDGTAEKK